MLASRAGETSVTLDSTATYRDSNGVTNTTTVEVLLPLPEDPVPLDLEFAARVDRLDRAALDHAASLGAAVRDARRADARRATAAGRPDPHPSLAIGRPAATGH